MRKIVLAFCLLCGIKSLAADEYPCSSETLLRLSSEYVARAAEIGKKLNTVKRIEAITFERNDAISIMSERRNLEDASRQNDQMFLSRVGICQN